jgi:Na+-translocating ferredoxin:NAD+ oxidoreductase RnfA subunit
MLSSKPNRPVRFWIEGALGAVTGLLAVLTAIWRDWLEVFGIAADYRGGSTEWLIVGVLFVSFLAFAIAAGVEWRRAAGAAE